MFSNRVFILACVLWLTVFFKQCSPFNNKRNWDYEPISVEVFSPDPSKLYGETRVVRSGRNEMTASGIFIFNYDLDDDTMVEAASYFSSTGSEADYKMMPWAIPKQRYKDSVSTFYTDIIYPNVKSCSNMPEPKDAYPWPRNNYTFEKCVSEGKGLPNILPEGYYKVHVNITSEVNWSIVGIVKVITDKLFA